MPRPQRSTLFPYTTLFRSLRHGTAAGARGAACGQGQHRRQAGQRNRQAWTHLDHHLVPFRGMLASKGPAMSRRSEEHTSELQSHVNLVCRLLLEKKKEEDL